MARATLTVTLGEEPGTVDVHAHCLWCSKPSQVTGVPRKGLELFQRGVHIQLALPRLSDDDREILVSGTHGPCWDEAFPEEGGPAVLTQVHRAILAARARKTFTAGS